MTIYARFGDPVTILRLATADDVRRLEGRIPDAKDQHQLEVGAYFVVQHEDDGSEALTHRCYLRADGGGPEIDAAIRAVAPPAPDPMPTPPGQILLSDAAIEVLTKLDAGPCPSSKRTHGQWISGASASSLAVKGLVKRLPETPDQTGTVYEITEEGRELLRRVKPCS